MKQTIEAKEQELKRIFSDDYLFEIPAYQRPYAWTTEQTSELLDDLLIAMAGKEEVGEVSPYFLGSIVLIKDPAKASAQVVDGQQRLTTLTILLCVLRELAEGDEWRRSLDKSVRAEGDVGQGTKDSFRLSLRERDRDYFQKNIQERGQLRDFLKQDKAALKDSQKRMFENTSYLYNQLSEISQSERNRLTLFLNQRCYIVVVSASDQNSAYRIFSVMNDRGLDLSPTDILKADIIGVMPEDIRTQYTEQWENIEEELGRDDFKDLFAHIRMIYMKSKQRGTLNLEFRDGVLANVNGKEFIDEVLVPFAQTYEIISKEAYESSHNADKVNSYLGYLGRLDNYDWVPPAISYFNRHRTDEDVLIQFTRDLERLAYALFIRRANINERINRYVQVLRTIEQNGDLFAETSPLQLTSVEKEDVCKALDGPIYLQTRVRKPLLLRLDSLLADHGATYDHKVISIEHVLPQTPAYGSTWLQWFPSEEDRELWTHRLAILVLLSRQKNAQAQNYDFERKKSEYFKRKGVATFAITSQILSEAEWNMDVLNHRQTDLLNRLKVEWRLG